MVVRRILHLGVIASETPTHVSFVLVSFYRDNAIVMLFVTIGNSNNV